MDNIFVWVIIWIICAFIAGGISSSKGQPFRLGFFYGLFLGIIGVIIVAISLPNINSEQVKQLEADEARAKELQESRNSTPLQPNIGLPAYNFGTISISSKFGKMGRLASYSVIINDQKVGAIGYNEEVAFKIPSGDCVIYIKNIGAKSNSIGIKLDPNQTVRLNVHYNVISVVLMREQ